MPCEDMMYYPVQSRKQCGLSSTPELLHGIQIYQIQILSMLHAEQIFRYFTKCNSSTLQHTQKIYLRFNDNTDVCRMDIHIDE